MSSATTLFDIAHVTAVIAHVIALGLTVPGAACSWYGVKAGHDFDRTDGTVTKLRDHTAYRDQTRTESVSDPGAAPVLPARP